MESLIGVLEKVIVISCGIEYKHTFAVVDFGAEPNFEIIKMIQDWGYNYIYLRHDCVITRINLRNHSY